MASPQPSRVPSVLDQPSTGFFRKGDPTVLFANVHEAVQVSLQKFTEAIAALALNANLGERDFKVLGDQLDNRFEIRFLGPTHDAATSKTLQFYQSLQLAKGKWVPQNVLDPTGKSNQFYISVDKNLAQVRKEILAKGLKDIVGKALGRTDVFFRRATGAVFVDKRVLATVSIPDEDTANIVWTQAKLIALGLDQVAIEQQFKELASKGGQSS